jgi:hypothetical protein
MNRSDVLDPSDRTVAELTKRFEALAPSPDWSHAVQDAIGRDNLLSVHRHAAEGAAAIEEYIRDARASEDIELGEYLERLQAVYAETAARAQELLLDRIINVDGGR